MEKQIKMKTKTLVKTLCASALFLSASVMFFSCDNVGLGKAVDTQPPTVSITYPPTDSVIRGTFTLSGKAEDEKKVESVTITLERTTDGVKWARSGEDSSSYSATINTSAKTWQVSINTFLTDSYEIPDGTYKVTATALDGAGRKTTAEAVYTIDNTKPILIVSQPTTTKESGSVHQFGSMMQFEGMQYDLNTDTDSGSRFTFTFYDEEGNLVHTLTKYNSLASWTITIEDKDFGDIQSALNYSDKEIDALYALSVEDKAYEYTDLSELKDGAVDTSKKTGNKTEHFYTQTQINSVLALGENQPSIKAVSALENGSDLTGQVLPAALKAADGREKLLNLAVPSAVTDINKTVFLAKAGVFSIDPDNLNPSILIDGFEYPTSATSNQIAPNTSLRIEVTKGKNEDPIVTSDMKYTLGTWNGSSYVDSVEKTLSNFNESTNTVISLNGPADGGRYRITFNITDNKSRLVKNTDNTNSFEFYVNTGAPTVSLSPGDGTEDSETGKTVLPADGKITTKFTVTDDSEPSYLNMKVQQIVKTAGETTYSDIAYTEAGAAVISTAGTRNTKTWTLKFDAPADGGSINLLFTANDGKYYSSVSRKFTVDTTAPGLLQLESPAAQTSGLAEGKVVANENIVSITGYASPDLTAVKFCITTKDETPDVSSSGWGNTSDNSVSSNIETLTIGGNSVSAKKFTGKVTLFDEMKEVCYVWARFGDASYDAATDSMGNPEKLFAVILNKDSPVLTETTYGETSSAIKYTTAADYTFKGSVSDDNGLSSFSYTAQFDNGEDLTDSLDTAAISAGAWEIPLTNLASGLYVFTFKAVDATGRSSSLNRSLYIDTEAPVVEIKSVTPATSDSKINGKITIRGTISDNDKVAEGTYTFTAANSVDSKINQTVGDKLTSWSFEVDTRTAVNGKKLSEVLTFAARDRSGNAADITNVKADLDDYTIDHDSDAPIITPKNFSIGVTAESGVTPDTNLFTQSEKLELTVYDDDGIGSIEISIDGTVKYSGTNANVSFPLNITQGYHKVTVNVVDNALGETATTGDFWIGIDNGNPELTITSTVEEYPKTAFQIAGTVSDGNELARLYWFNDDLPGTINEIPVTKDNTEQTWSVGISLPAVSEDTDLTFVAVDKYGRTKEAKAAYKFDRDKPVLDSVNFDAEARLNLNGVIFIDKSKTLFASGTASEPVSSVSQSGLASVKYAIINGHNAAAPSDDSKWKAVSGTGTWAANISLASNDDGPYTVFVKAVDISGNDSEIQTQNITVDTTGPALTVTAPAAETSDYKGETLTIKGTAKDTYVLSSVVITAAKNNVSIGEVYSYTASGTLNEEQDWEATYRGTGTLEDGTYVFTITATDLTSNVSTASRIVTIDTTKPTLTVSNLADGAFITTSTYEISGTVYDANSLDAAGVQYSLDGAEFTSVTNPTAWKHVVENITEGTGKKIQFKVKDRFGNEATTEEILFGLDLHNPTLTMVSVDGTAFSSWAPKTPKNNNIELNFTSYDASGIKALDVSTDSGASYTAASKFTTAKGAAALSDSTKLNITEIVKFPAEEGLTNIWVRATDIYDKETFVKFVVMFDKTPPDLTIKNLSDGLLITETSLVNEEFTVSGIWSDNGGSGLSGGSAKIEYSLDGGTTWTEFFPAGSWTKGVPLSQKIAQSISFRATDNVGNTTAEADYVTFSNINVDTSVPALTVNASASYNKKDSTYILDGTAIDTLALDRVEVVPVKNGVTQTVWKYEAAGTLTETKTWSYELAGDTANDGPWSFTITAYDEAGRTSASVTRSVVMDATAPTAPASAFEMLDASANAGSTFVFRGSASDSGSGVAKVETAFTTAAQTSADIGTIITAAGTETWSTKVESLSATLGSEGEKKMYVRVTDKAGNESAWSDAAFTYDTSAPTVTVTESEDRLTKEKFSLSASITDNYGIKTVTLTEQKDSGTAEEIGGFTLNSTTGKYEIANLPSTGLVSGVYTYQITAKDNAEKETTKTVKVTVDIEAPNENTIDSPASDAVGAASLSGGAYTFKGSAKDAGTGLARVWYVFSESDTAPAGTTGYTSIDTTGSWSIADDFDTDQDGGDTGRAEGQWYLHVKAEDKVGNISDAVTRLFFVDQHAPALTGTALSVSKAKKGETVIVSGKATDSGLGSTSKTFDRVVIKLDGVEKKTIYTSELGKDPYPAETGSWSYTFTTDDIPQDTTATHTVSVTAIDKAEKTDVYNGSFFYDIQAPTVVINNALPQVTKGGVVYVNGVVTISGTFQDDNMVASAAASWTGKAGPASKTVNMTGSTNTYKSWSFDLDTATLTDKADTVVKVTAADGVGNTESMGITLKVDQSTDKPSVDVSNADELVTEINSSTNLFGVTSNNKLLGTVTDDDGVAKLEISTDGGTVWTSIFAGETATSRSFDYVHGITTEGEYTVQLRATDINNKVSTSDMTSTGTPDVSFRIAVDNGAPTFTGMTPANGNFFSSAIAVSGTITDGSGTAEITAGAAGGNSVLVPPSGSAVSGAAWSDNVDVSGLSSGSYTKIYTANDKYGQTSTYALSFNVDRDKPTVSLTKPADNEYIEKEKVYEITGTAAETGSSSLSGLSSVTYTVKSGETVKETGTVAVSSSGTAASNWSTTLIFSDDTKYSEAAYTVEVVSKDKAGNVSDTVSKTINLDKSAPTLSETTVNTGGKTTNAAFTFGGSVQDTNKIQSLVITHDKDAAFKKEVSITQNNSLQTWSQQITVGAGADITADGTYIFTITATDIANKTTLVQRTVVVDTSAPTVTLTKPADNEYIKKENVYEIKGTAAETGTATVSGLASVTYTVKAGAAVKETAAVAVSSIGTTASNWSAAVNFTNDTTYPEGTYTVTVVCADKAGNTTDSITRTIYLDKDDPVIGSLVKPAEYVNATYAITGSLTETYLKTFTWARTGTTAGGTAETDGETLVYNGGWKLSSDGTTASTLMTGTMASWSLSQSALTDGSWTYTLTAEDNVGRKAVQTFSTILDRAAPEVTITAPAVNESTINASYTAAQGTVSDLGSGIKEVTYALYTVDGETETAVTGTGASGTAVIAGAKWTIASLPLANEGTYRLKLTAADKLNQTTTASATFFRDASAPTLTETTVDTVGKTTNASFEFGGSVQDTNKIQSVIITHDKDAAFKKEVSITQNNSLQTWSQQITVGTSADITADGTYTFTITATDIANKTTIIQRTVVVDSSAPTVTLTKPTDNEYIKKENVYEIKGTAAETGSSTVSGLASVTYTIKAGETVKETAAVSVSSIGTASSNWSAAVNFANDTTYPEGTYTVTVVCADKAGNTTASITRTVYLDKSEPDIDILEKPAAYVNAGYTITGSLTETYLKTFTWARTGTTAGGTAESVSETLVYNGGWKLSSDGTTASALMTGTTASWSFNQSALTGGSWTYTLTAEDYAGRTSVLTFSTIFDTAAPDVTITAPAENESTINASYTAAQGTVSDLGSGVKEVTYALYTVDGETETAVTGTDASGTAVITGAKWTIASLPLANEGTYRLKLTAADNLLQTTDDSATFFRDASAPTLSETTVNTSGKTTNTSFTFGGNVQDTNKIQSLVITHDKDAAFKKEVSITQNNVSQDWTQKIYVVGDSSIPEGSSADITADGTYTFTITATDIANKTTIVQRSVVVDRTAPVLSAETITTDVAATVGLTEYYKTSTLAVSVTAKDENGSGVSIVEYSTDDTSYSSMTKGSNDVWTANVSVQAGSNTITLRAKDAAQNEVETSLTAVVDIAPPSVNLFSIDGDEEDITGIKYYNKEKDIVLSIESSDAGSGVSKVYAKIGSTVFTDSDAATYDAGTSRWNITFAKANLTDGTVNIKAVDTCGNYNSITSFQISVDAEKPSVSFSTPLTGVTVNKTIKISGFASDAKALKSVVLEKRTGESEWTVIPIGANIYSWAATADFDTDTAGLYDTVSDDALTPSTLGTQAELRVTAADYAGNTAAETINITVDQTSDIPVIKMVNVNTDNETKLKMLSTVYGSVTDDDGIESFSISENGTDWATATATETTGTLVIEGSTWTYTPTDSDGQKSLYFKVVEKASLTSAITFITGGTDQPYVQDSTNTKVLSDTPVTFRVDKHSPEIITDVYIDMTPDLTANNDPVNASPTYSFNDTTLTAHTTNMIVGGPSPKFALRIAVVEANGPNTVTVNYTKEDETQGVSTAVLTSGSGTSTDPYIYVTSVIDSSVMPNNYVTMSIKAKDSFDLESTISKTIHVDNQDPTSVVTSPDPTVQQTGAVIMKGSVDDDTNGTGIKSVKYQIPPVSGYDFSAESTAWKDITEFSVAWEIEFSGETELSEYANSTNAFEKGGTGSGVWTIPVVLRVEDKAGNVYLSPYEVDTSSGLFTTDVFTVLYNPDGDKPTVTPLYPIPAAGTSSVLGGSVRAFGEASDNEIVNSIYYQIDMTGGTNGGNDVFDDSDKTALAALTKTDGITKIYTVVEFGAVGTEGESGYIPAWWGIKAEGTVSWNFTFNAYGEFNPTGEESRTISYRVRSKDGQGAVSIWSDVYSLKIDKNTPQIGAAVPLKLVQYSDNENGTGTVTAEQDYTSGMYIKGKWYLTGSIGDNEGISKIEVATSTEGTQINYKLSDTGQTVFEAETDLFKGYSMNIPINSTTTELIVFSITAYDTTTPNPYSAIREIKINCDNTAPEQSSLLNGKGGDAVTETDKIVQSDGSYALSSTVTESGSGYKRVAVYFMRDVDGETTTNDRLYNPMEEYLAADGTATANRTLLSELDVDVNGKPVMTEGLYRKTLTDSGTAARTDTETFTNAGITTNMNIRVGGLVYIGGLDRKITNINRTAGTVTFTPSVDVKYVEAKFAYALIIDNFSIEYLNNGVIEGDDGDGIVETVSDTASGYLWNTYINSKNIPDGPITVYTVAYDNAGNYKEMETKTSVENNGPRISSIKLGTDLNGFNGVEESEYVAFSTLNELTKEPQVNVAVTADGTGSVDHFTARGITKIKFDTVGGNGILEAYSTITGNKDNVSATATAAQVLYDPDDTTYDGTVTYSLESGELSGFDDTDSLTFNLTIWDSTEELARGSTSQSAKATIKMSVDCIDDIAPKTAITPFYWKSTEENSLYGNSSANGHIELEDDLPTAFTASTGVTDKDPKVSGKITIEGTAYDNSRITDMYALIDSTALFPFNTSSGTLTAESVSVNSTAYSIYKLGSYSAGTWTPVKADAAQTDAENVDEYGWAFEAADISIDQSGHRVSWKLHLNTEKITGVTGLDKNIRIFTKDRGNSFSSNVLIDTVNSVPVVGDDTQYNNPVYRVDVVPYITGILRNAAYTTNRSRFGKYSIQMGDAAATDRDLSVYGFNIAAPVLRVISESENTLTVTETSGTAITASSAAVTSGELTTAGLSGGSTKVYIASSAAPLKSGYLMLFSSVTSGGTTSYIPALNNLNNDDAHGEASAGTTLTALADYYNREVVTTDTGSIKWTDDRYVMVWNVDKYLAGTDGYQIEYPAMSMDNTGKLYGSWIDYSNNTMWYNYNGADGSLTGAGTLPSLNSKADPYMYYDCYDPAEYSDIYVDPSTNKPYVAFLPNHVGNAGTWTLYGVMNHDNNGGLSVYSPTASLMSIEGKTGGTQYARAYSIESQGMDIQMKQFQRPKVVSKGSNIHTVYYDAKSKTAKYAYINDTDTMANRTSQVGWVVLDGTPDEQDYLLYKDQEMIAGNLTSSSTGTITTGVSGGEAVIPKGSLVTTSGQGGIGIRYVKSVTNAGVVTLNSNVAIKDAGDALGSYTIHPNVIYFQAWALRDKNTDETRDGALKEFTYPRLKDSVDRDGVDNGAYFSEFGFTAGQLVGQTVTVRYDNKAFTTTIASFTIDSNVEGGEYGLITLTDAVDIESLQNSYSTTNIDVFMTIHRNTFGSALVPNGITNTAAAGQHLAIDVDESGYPVVMYYDITNATLKLARATSDQPKKPSDWVRQNVFSVTDPNNKNSGTYVSMKIDSSGAIHAACFNTKGKLIYLYAPNNSGTGEYTFSQSIDVDTDSAGNWADITVKGTTPYISYLNNGMVETADGIKYAYPTATNANGVWDEWENIIVPAPRDHVPTAERISLEMNQKDQTNWSNWAATWGDAAIGFRSDRFELVFLKGEN